MLLNAKTVEIEGNVPVIAPAFNPPWWVNPLSYCLFFLLPFFLATVLLAGPYMAELRQKIDNMTFENIALGVASILLLAIGAAPFCSSAKMRNERELNISGINLALLFLGGVSLFCNLIFFSSTIMQPSVILQFFSGNLSAASGMRAKLSYVSGITSFISACLPYFSLYGATYALLGKDSISIWARRLFLPLLFFTAARALLASERLALVEAIVSFAVPFVVFRWKAGTFRKLLPYIGMVGVFLIFAAGEYFRSWKFYQTEYSSYMEFATVRFFGYFATAINTGAGIVSHYEPIGLPSITITGVYKMLYLLGINLKPQEGLIDDYLYRYATPEFNNPGGLYMPYVDYGIVWGAVFILITGIITGFLYKAFIEKRPIGIVLYPMWFLALLDVVRLWMWGANRFIPVIMVSLFTVYVFRLSKRKAGPIMSLGGSKETEVQK